MGRYHPCPTALPQVGRRLDVWGGYAAAKRALLPEEDLYLWLDRGTRQIAPLIPNQREWDEFYNQYIEGWWLEYAAYAVKKEEAWT